MSKPSGRSQLFRKFILSLCIVIFLPTIIISGISYFRSVQQMKNLVEEYLSQITITINSKVDSFVSDYEKLSLPIVNMREVKQFLELSPDNYYGKYVFKDWINKNVFKEIMNQRPFIEGFHIVSDKGVVYSEDTKVRNSGGSSNIEGRLPLLHDKLPQHGKFKVFTSKDLEGSSSNSINLTLTIARRIYAQSEYQTKGTFILDINASELSEFWKKNDLKGGQIWIVDDEWNIIFRPNNQAIEDMFSRQTKDQGFLKQSGSYTHRSPAGDYFITYHTSDYTGWKVIATVPLKQMNKPIEELRNDIVFSSVIAFLLALAVGYIFINSISKPIKKLKQMMLEVGRGNWVKVEGRFPQDEIGDLMSGFNQMVDKISELISQVYEAELSRRKEELSRHKAELQALQMQINPHFIYNTLGAIDAYVFEGEKMTTHKMIDSLGSMLRYAVRDPLEPVKLSDEVRHVQNYLLIQQYRQPCMPKITWNVQEFLDSPILRLTMQPIIENIFHHAFPDGIEAFHEISITAYCQDGMFIVALVDNGIGLSPDPIDTETFISNNDVSSRGIGLSNVHRRLQLAYGPGSGLKISKTKGGGTTVEMHIPIAPPLPPP